ncbi:MAG: hypothetical protein QOH06_1666 [Acidobacteriota bacterium]|jgi:hypothetical protein|nr:hypothetical protein [Acidobacteriota bacterium]
MNREKSPAEARLWWAGEQPWEGLYPSSLGFQPQAGVQASAITWG